MKFKNQCSILVWDFFLLLTTFHKFFNIFQTPVPSPQNAHFRWNCVFTQPFFTEQYTALSDAKVLFHGTANVLKNLRKYLANKSGCSTNSTRLENCESLIVVMCGMLEWHLAFRFLLLCEWPQSILFLCHYCADTVGCASVGCATVGRATVGRATVWCATVGCVQWGVLQWGVQQRTVFINELKMLLGTRRNIISRRSTS